MTDVGQKEVLTQERVIHVFIGMGYRYLGNWKDKVGNSNLEEALLRPWLQKCGYSFRPEQCLRQQ